MELAAQDKSITSQFFLTGGTALSYFYLQHRFSEDLDFFSISEVDARALVTWASQASKKLEARKLEQQGLAAQQIFFFHFDDSSFVKVDFAYFPFDHLGTFKKFHGLRVASLEDIIVNKFQSIITRKRARDYLDLYLGLKKLGWTLAEARKNYRLKFDMDLESQQLATSFVSVVDATDLPEFLGSYSWTKVREFFLESAQKLKGDFIDE